METKTNSKILAHCYMGINEKDYNNNLKKIGFVLSFMTRGPAKAWTDQYTKNTLSLNQNQGLNLGTYSDFRKHWSDTFSTYDTPGDALNEIKNLRMKPEEDINSHITKFITLLSESRLDKNLPAVVDFFRETLPVKLQIKIMNLENPPKV